MVVQIRFLLIFMCVLVLFIFWLATFALRKVYIFLKHFARFEDCELQLILSFVLCVYLFPSRSLRIGSVFRGGATKRATSPVKFATRLDFYKLTTLSYFILFFHICIHVCTYVCDLDDDDECHPLFTRFIHQIIPFLLQEPILTLWQLI